VSEHTILPGLAENSNTISVTTVAGLPGIPVATSATGITSTGFMANWNASQVRPATGWMWLPTAVLLPMSMRIMAINGLSSNIGGLTSNTTYYYRVRAYNTSGTSGNSNTISVTTIAGLPGIPVATSATGITSTGFTANWNASSGSTSYRLDVAANSSFTTYVYANMAINGLSSNIGGLTANTTYYYRVRGYNDSGTSGNSNTISVTTVAGLPGITCSHIGNRHHFHRVYG